MPKLNEIPVGDSIHGMFYGGAGSGKSWLLGTLNSDRALYCNVEDRLATFQSPGFKSKFPKWNPEVITVNEGLLPDAGAEALDSLTLQIRQYLEAHEKDIDVIMVDGATSLRRFAMNKGMELAQKMKKSQSITKLKALDSQIEYVDFEMNDFTAEMRLILGFIQKMKEYCSEAKIHFFMTAHERITYNKPASIGDIATINSIKPGFTGKTFPDDIPGLFDLVWHMETKGGGEQIKYYARTAGDSALQSKTCYNGLFPTMYENPNLVEIIKKIKERK